MPITLAASDLFNQILPWLGGLVVLTVIGGFIMIAARRYLTGDPARTNRIGFSLHELRTLKDSGEISEAEYERAKANFMNSTAISGDKPQVSEVNNANKTGTKPPSN